MRPKSGRSVPPRGNRGYCPDAIRVDGHQTAVRLCREGAGGGVLNPVRTAGIPWTCPGVGRIACSMENKILSRNLTMNDPRPESSSLKTPAHIGHWLQSRYFPQLPHRHDVSPCDFSENNPNLGNCYFMNYGVKTIRWQC